jgi:hypothetical protein
MMMLLDICSLLTRLPLLAQTEDGQYRAECRLGAAVEAYEKQENNAENNTNDDSGNGSTAETTSA